MPTYTKTYRGALEFDVSSTPFTNLRLFPGYDNSKISKYVMDELFITNDVHITNFNKMLKITIEWVPSQSYFRLTLDMLIGLTNPHQQTSVTTYNTVTELRTAMVSVGLGKITGVMRFTSIREDYSGELSVIPILKMLPNTNVYFLYTVQSEKNQITKNLTFVESGYLQFNSVVSPLGFTLDMKRGITDAKFNYMYIPTLHRYYFVDDMELTNNMMRLHLSEDVLSSWDSLIRDQSGLVTRNQYLYSDKLVDNRLPLENTLTVDYTDITGGTYSNVTFNTTNFFYSGTVGGQEQYDKRTILLISIDNLTAVPSPYPKYYDPNIPGLPQVGNIDFHHGSLYALKYAEMFNLSESLFNDDTVASYVTSCMILPFELNVIADSSQSSMYIKDKILGNDYQLHDRPYSGTPATVYHISAVPPYLIIADYTVTERFNSVSYPEKAFMNYEPYTQYEFLIPFIGWIKLPSADIVGKRLLFYYALDYDSGNATFYVLNYDDGVVIYTSNCQLGINIPINTSNREEIRRQKENNQLSTAVSLIGDVVQIGVGSATGNAKSVVGGAVGIGKAISSFVNANNMLMERAQTKSGASETMLYVRNDRIVMRRTYNDTLGTNATVYAKTQGYPINRYMTLSVLSGYTEIGELHFECGDTDILSGEIDSILQELQNGVIF